MHVVAAGSAEEAAALAAAVLRADPAEIQENGDAAVSDLLRRLNRLTALTHGPGRVRELAQDPGRHAGRAGHPRALGHLPGAATTRDGLGAGAGGVHRRERSAGLATLCTANWTP